MGKPYTEEEYNLLTLQDVVENHDMFVADGSKKKDQAKYQNFVNPHLLAGEPTDKVLGIINIPELHCIIGVVDKHIIGLENIFGIEWMDQYLKDVCILRKSCT